MQPFSNCAHNSMPLSSSQYLDDIDNKWVVDPFIDGPACGWKYLTHLLLRSIWVGAWTQNGSTLPDQTRCQPYNQWTAIPEYTKCKRMLWLQSGIIQFFLIQHATFLMLHANLWKSRLKKIQMKFLNSVQTELIIKPTSLLNQNGLAYKSLETCTH